jgi:hypothetical protein
MIAKEFFCFQSLANRMQANKKGIGSDNLTVNRSAIGRAYAYLVSSGPP